MFQHFKILLKAVSFCVFLLSNSQVYGKDACADCQKQKQEQANQCEENRKNGGACPVAVIDCSPCPSEAVRLLMPNS